MNDQVLESAPRDYRRAAEHEDANAEAILEGAVVTDQSLEQVREILFGAKSRRSEMERRALESKFRERFDKLEAEYERRFEKLSHELHQRFEKSCALLEAESAARREAMQTQHDELVAQLGNSARCLGQAKTDREELAGLLDEVANRLRIAATV